MQTKRTQKHGKKVFESKKFFTISPKLTKNIKIFALNFNLNSNLFTSLHFIMTFLLYIITR